MSERRSAVDFDPDHFARCAALGQPLDPKHAFRHAYATNLWGGRETASGPGASLVQTARLAQAIPELCRRLGVKRLLDIPCGEGHWMAAVALPDVHYVGADLLPEIVASAAARNRDSGRAFEVIDLTSDALPAGDVLLCRDCLVHLSFTDVARVVANIRRSAITYLLTTTFPGEPANVDIRSGDWRPLNLELSPFGFPAPIETIVEGCSEQGGLFADKCLGLWRVADLPRIIEDAA